MRLRTRTFNRLTSTFLSALLVLALATCAPAQVSQESAPAANCAPQTLITTAANTSTSPEILSSEMTTIGLADMSGTGAIAFTADALGLPLADDAVADLYAAPSVLMQANDRFTVEITVPAEGDYTFAFDAVVPADAAAPEGQIRIDGSIPDSDMQQIAFPVLYEGTSDTFPRDRYGNDALIPQRRATRWTTIPVRDVDVSLPYPIRVMLSAGAHTVEFTLNEGALYVGTLYLVPFTPYPTYAEYLAAQTTSPTVGFQTSIEAEFPLYKNDTAVRPSSSRSLTVTPYDTYCLLMNTMGGESWIRSGTAVYYAVSVPEDGLYAITLRAMQNVRSNFTVFRRITINGAVPFAEFNAVPFRYSTDWVDMHLGGETPYTVFLRRGVNVIGIEANSAPYSPAIETIQAALEDINTLALEINRLTGNQQDPFREWEIGDYIPDIAERLNAMAQNLIDDQATLLSIDPSGASPEILTYRIAIDNLRFLATDPNSIPISMNRFSEGTGSAAQQLASLLPLLQNQPLALDRIIVHSPDIVPQTPSVPVTTAIWEDVRRFLQSFQPDPYRSLTADEGELEVWVNRPRQYVDLLQLLADTTFTPQTGIPVRFSIMPDESKLILANAAGNQPDLALGVSTDRPYELAIRNALYDLRTFPDFDTFIRHFSPGSLLGYIINDSVYALPETQDFWVTFYREDIMDSLGLTVPDTWDEVLEILPELQRFGMNYQTPLSSGTGQRGYLVTAPFLFNHGADLYTADGLATGLESNEAVAGIEFMADIFTIYDMPRDTASFYQSFRNGTLPVGISNAETYMRLTTAAAELTGRWGLDLYPATVLADGTENRYATGSAQTSIMFSNTNLPEQGWAFLQWWLSTETQARFQDELITNYGREYLWFSANLEAFASLDIPDEHRDVILEQWQWLQEPSRLPGSYMQEREISNIWNRIVFQGASPRVAIDRSVTTINREIARKMEEFGYLADGVSVRDYRVPTIATVISWMENAD